MLKITPHITIRGAYTLRAEQWLPRPLEEVFAFFADAYRLQDLTPAFLNFEVVTPKPIEMRPGLKIDYRIRLHGIPVVWQSEISDWEPPHRFVDQQLKGPYRLWHHEHTFEAHDGGTLVRDVVDYAVPGGRLIHWLIVRKDLERIFADRREKLTAFFGNTALPASNAR
jgi:ligand-binding SRPBCC domain-containing protein